MYTNNYGTQIIRKIFICESLATPILRWITQNVFLDPGILSSSYTDESDFETK